MTKSITISLASDAEKYELIADGVKVAEDLTIHEAALMAETLLYDLTPEPKPEPEPLRPSDPDYWDCFKGKWKETLE